MKFSKLVGALFTAILALQMHAGQQESRGLVGKIARAAQNVRRAWHRKRNGDIRDAIINGRLSAVQTFLDDGFDLNEEGHYSNSLLVLAVEYGQADIVRLLIERGGDMKVTCQNKESILHEGVRSGNVEVVRVLLEQGAAVNCSACIALEANEGRRNYERWSYIGSAMALHLAAQSGNAPIAKLLIEYGADLGAQDDAGATAVYRALVPTIEDRDVPFYHRNLYEWETRYRPKDSLRIYTAPGREAVAKLLLRESGFVCTSADGNLSPLRLVLEQLHDVDHLYSCDPTDVYPRGRVTILKNPREIEANRLAWQACGKFLESMARWLAEHGESLQEPNRDFVRGGLRRVFPSSLLKELTRLYQEYQQKALSHLQEHFPRDLCKLILSMK